ncbi:hydantoinase/oxoprolinase family protein [Agrobacterium tumefaciens]|uniref:hydantoinase/oxoprolinase family protein n=1 Tax=Agrobacterium tumefaciens TaxID=358 RepID=UPI0015740C29|nr:hydantoinase/oxoprolinase family protein [Agrobacterium tumefaciens]NTA50700.1 hydantoinase/oxoprolinase family protein [Agrobacterium tumefaciens]
MYRIGVDVGGTFTDFVMVNTNGGQTAFHKVPSTPDDPSRAIAAGISEILELNGVDPSDVGYVGHGTTVATNMVIEGRGVPTGLLTTKGFRDVLAIGRQTRPSLYDWSVRKPDPLVERYRRVEIEERLDKDGNQIAVPDLEDVRKLVVELKNSGVQAVAVGFLHSYRNPQHEQMVRDVIAEVAPELYVSISSDVVAEFREFERFSTTVLNAYVGPRTQKYLHRLREKIAASGIRVEPLTFHSNGGLLPVQTVEELPVLTCLSGPAAGVIGSARIGADIGETEIITFDVGGTSTDVSLITGGRAQFTSSRLVAGHPVRMPMVDIHVIGAGGGSIAKIDDAGALKVGPVSAGAMPGPISYLRGGTEVTLTDANIVLGRLNPVALLEGRMKVDRDLAEAAIRRQIAEPLGISVEDAASGILSIATANMSRAIRSVSTEHGHDLGNFTLYAFGGAGALHAAEVAEECGLRKIVVPQEPGTLCARGVLLSDLSRDYVRTALITAKPETWHQVVELGSDLAATGKSWLEAEADSTTRGELHFTLDARYRGQSHYIPVPIRDLTDAALDEFSEKFHRLHAEQFGYRLNDHPVDIVNIRLKAVCHVPKGESSRPTPGTTLDGAKIDSRNVYFDKAWFETPIYRRALLPAAIPFTGPAIVEEMSGTTVILPGQTAEVDDFGNIHIAPKG